MKIIFSVRGKQRVINVPDTPRGRYIINSTYKKVRRMVRNMVGRRP
ncbi:MAG: hypothetical protein QXT26_05570 [Thermoproteota archaeon]